VRAQRRGLPAAVLAASLAGTLAASLVGCGSAASGTGSVPGSGAALRLGASVRVLQGNFRFGRGEDALASLRYLQALGNGERWSPWILYDLGTQYVALGELEAGLRRLGEATEAQTSGESRALRELAFRRAFNFGVARFEAGQFEEAAWSFIEALRRKPDDWDAKHNLELSIRSSLGSAQRGASSPPSAARGGEQARRQLERLHEQEEPAWTSAPSAEAYARDW
jgi:tetratricopeptide (TPR) repeat protein